MGEQLRGESDRTIGDRLEGLAAQLDQVCERTEETQRSVATVVEDIEAIRGHVGEIKAFLYGDPRSVEDAGLRGRLAGIDAEVTANRARHDELEGRFRLVLGMLGAVAATALAALASTITRWFRDV